MSAAVSAGVLNVQMDPTVSRSPAGVGFGKDALRKKRADLFGLFVEL